MQRVQKVQWIKKWVSVQEITFFKLHKQKQNSFSGPKQFQSGSNKDENKFNNQKQQQEQLQ